MNWNEKVKLHADILCNLEITLPSGEIIPIDHGFQKLKLLLEAIRNNRSTVYAVGNGASASMASHFSADLAKNGQLHTQVFSDLSLITAISNDLSYDEVFSEPLRRRGEKGDLLVAVSSSGNSENILSAARAAHDIGMSVVTFSAMHCDNQLRKTGEFNLYIPAESYGNAESAHATILHYWIDLLVDG